MVNETTITERIYFAHILGTAVRVSAHRMRGYRLSLFKGALSFGCMFNLIEGTHISIAFGVFASELALTFTIWNFHANNGD